MAEQPSDAPVNEPSDDAVETQPGNEVDEAQENVGRDNMAGQGEWPDPDTPPTGPSPGDASDAPAPDSPAETFKDVLEADPVAGGSATFPPDQNPATQQPAADQGGEPEA